MNAELLDVENAFVETMADLCQALYVKEKAEEAGTSVEEAMSTCERLKQVASDTKKKYDDLVAVEKMENLPHQTKTDLDEIKRLTAQTSKKWEPANFCANPFCMLKRVKLPKFSDPQVEVTIQIDEDLKFISHPTKPNIHYLLGNSDQGMVVVVHKGSMYF
jgi:hypothetical protein